MSVSPCIMSDTGSNSCAAKHILRKMICMPQKLVRIMLQTCCRACAARKLLRGKHAANLVYYMKRVFRRQSFSRLKRAFSAFFTFFQPFSALKMKIPSASRNFGPHPILSSTFYFLFPGSTAETAETSIDRSEPAARMNAPEKIAMSPRFMTIFASTPFFMDRKSTT